LDFESTATCVALPGASGKTEVKTTASFTTGVGIGRASLSQPHGSAMQTQAKSPMILWYVIITRIFNYTRNRPPSREISTAGGSGSANFSGSNLTIGHTSS
jgi:hypothetical protein